MVLAVVSLAFSVGCQTRSHRDTVAPIRFERRDARPDRLRDLLLEFAQRFAGDTEVAADRILAESPVDSVRRNALLWKVHAIPACHRSTFREAPLTALLDTWALCVQMRRHLESGGGQNAFGALQESAIRAARGLEAGIVEIAAEVATDDGLERAHDLVEEWARLHPVQGPVLARPSISPRFVDAAFRPPRSRRVPGSTARLGELLDRFRVELQHLPKQIRWETRLLLDDLLEHDRVERTAEDIDRLSQDVTRITRIVERLPEILAGETRVVAGSLQRERVTALEEIDGQRDETIRELRKERLALVEALKQERTHTVEEVEKAASRALAASVPLGETVVDRFFVRATQYGAGALVVIAVLWTLVRLFAGAPGRGERSEEGAATQPVHGPLRKS